VPARRTDGIDAAASHEEMRRRCLTVGFLRIRSPEEGLDPSDLAP